MRRSVIAYYGALFLIGGVDFIEVHGPDGQKAFINPHEITSLREPTNVDLSLHFQRGAHCIVVTTNGKFLATKEHCEEIRNMILHKPLTD